MDGCGGAEGLVVQPHIDTRQCEAIGKIAVEIEGVHRDDKVPEGETGVLAEGGDEWRRWLACGPCRAAVRPLRNRAWRGLPSSERSSAWSPNSLKSWTITAAWRRDSSRRQRRRRVFFPEPGEPVRRVIGIIREGSRPLTRRFHTQSRAKVRRIIVNPRPMLESSGWGGLHFQVMEWNIKPRSEVCQVSGRPFTEDEIFYTTLTETKEGLERQDVCEEVWQQRNENIRPLCFWKSVFKATPPPEPEAVDRSDAESELRRLVESDNSHDRKVSFLLAAMLERKRILKVQDRVTLGGIKRVVYLHTQTQETFVIEEPEIRLSDLEQIRADLEMSSSKIFAKKEFGLLVGESPGPESGGEVAGVESSVG